MIYFFMFRVTGLMAPFLGVLYSQLVMACSIESNLMKCLVTKFELWVIDLVDLLKRHFSHDWMKYLIYYILYSSTIYYYNTYFSSEVFELS